MMNKLKSKAGESITEVLVSSLIVSLAFIMVFTMVNASKNIIELSIKRQQDYYTQRNKFEAQASSSQNGGTIIVQSTGSNNVTTINSDSIPVKVYIETIEGTDETLIQFERGE